MKYSISRFSPRKDSSFFRQATKTVFSGGTVLCRKNTPAHNEPLMQRYAIHVVQQKNNATKNEVKRRVRTMITSALSRETPNSVDIFVTITHWPHAAHALKSTLCHIIDD